MSTKHVVSTPEAWSASAARLAQTAFDGPTVPVVRDLLTTLNAYSPFTPRESSSKPTAILDSGCGPGQVAGRLITEFADDLPSGTCLVASDISDGMLVEMRKRRAAEMEVCASDSQRLALWTGLRIESADAHDMSTISDGSFTHVTAGLLYFMLKDPPRALREAHRVLAPGGALCLSSFGRVSWMEMMGLFARVKPGMQFPAAPKEWANIDGVRGQMMAAGFLDIRVHEVETFLEFEDARELVELLVFHVPSVVSLASELNEDERSKGIELMVEFLDNEYSNRPRRMPATAIVGVGRKEGQK